VTYFLVALDTILGIGLLVLVFLHSGKDAGLSTTFGGAAPSVAAAWCRRILTASP
jgi:protein translocase SecG subunit